METRTIIRSSNFCFSSRLLSKYLRNEIGKNIILRAAVYSYGYETWSLTLKYEHRLKACHNRVLKKILRAKCEELTGDCKTLRNGKLLDLYSTRNITRTISSRLTRSAGHVARMGKGQKKTEFS